MSVQCDGTVKALPLKSRDDSSEEDSDEDAQHEILIASLNQLSILERLGPSSDEMTEGEVESAFSQLTVAFRCDQYTLSQRLQAEEHARNKAEENLQLELQRGKEAVEALKDMCLDSKRYQFLQKLELTLDILGGTVEQVARTAEVLGAVHQEAKVSRAVELMVAHVENLRQRHDRHSVELVETKKMMSKSASFDQALPDLREEIEIRVRSNKDTGKFNLRRRVSASVITKESLSQEIKKPKEKESKDEVISEEKVTQKPAARSQVTEPKADSNPKMEDVECASVEDRQHVSPVEGAIDAVIAPTPSDVSPSACPGPSAVSNHDEVIPQIPNRPSQRALRRMRRSKSELDGYSSRGKREGHSHSDSEISATSPLPRVIGRQRLVVHWLDHCRWILTCVYLTILVSILLLAIFFWFLRTPVLWM
ncbi:inositol 1,4,5-triphosphate receptor associated 2 isoform X2 [Clupea harengus]|uniref:Inositol 1,4,5-triphosphate receptor associated 2 isoform X2 n=1 Tax=Clupea harengus TaxID=7950 RepID=A0A6P8FH36_CLUHA|nr:inositol 1,4,5-triphosphate receptor associated 2 isoform X2 [Clupea harengus]XP_031422876.1 inositol 1,4,5-triphosphate receptor associated 2 isoform X2 [Clupea harengus]